MAKKKKKDTISKMKIKRKTTNLEKLSTHYRPIANFFDRKRGSTNQ